MNTGGDHKHGYVISDLHLFSRRSFAEKQLGMIRDKVSQSQLFVFNGDIFDFRWTTLGTVEETVEQAAAWLDDLVSSFPHTQFHFVLGNHDSGRLFLSKLELLADKHEHLIWHPFYARLGDSLFLHGDASHGRNMTHDRLLKYRARFDEEQGRGKLMSHVYQSACTLGLHKSTYLLNPKRVVCKRIIEYFFNVDPDILKDVAHIYFGHTHTPFSDYKFNNISFHNTGSMIRGLTFDAKKILVNPAPHDWQRTAAGLYVPESD
ncbi:MAG: metallophosphoesterase [Bdellovibrionales bacterium]|nr:metallophosphoesterase [Bdellovibrionales bacterium]